MHASALYGRSHAAPEDEAIWTYMPYGPFDGLEEMSAWLTGNAASSDPMFFTVVERGEPVGVVSLMNIDTAMRRLELGHIWYVRPAQRGASEYRGGIPSAARGVRAMGLPSGRMEVRALNARSRAAAERLGFTFEGIFRSHMIVKGRNRDTAWFSMLDSEWPSRRDAMQGWLDAEMGTASLRDLMDNAG